MVGMPATASPAALLSMFCGEYSLVTGGLAVTLRCKRWSCPICQPFNLRALTARATIGDPTIFITLTANPRWGASPDARARLLVRAWRTLCRRIRARCSLKSVPFLAVFEATEKGEPHLHILARLPFIPQSWLSAQMRCLTRSPIVHIRKVANRTRAAHYIAKKPHLFKGTKRFWTSLNWSRERLTTAVSDKVWSVIPNTLDAIERMLSAAGILLLRRQHRLAWEPP